MPRLCFVCNDIYAVQRAMRRLPIFALVLCVALLSISLAACGLDEDYVVYAPTMVNHEPIYSNADFAENYFTFTTSDGANYSPSFNYRGTAVYYKIYGSVSTLKRNVDAIESANNSSQSDAADMVRRTYGYVELNTTSGKHSPLIVSNGTDQRVYIRLTSYQDTALHPEYAPKIIIGYAGDKKAAATYIPVRNASGRQYHFDFGRRNAAKYGSAYADNAKVPQSGDDDVEGSSADGKWYVDMYAVGVGNDASFTKYYSRVLHLGTVPIDANKEDN